MGNGTSQEESEKVGFRVLGVQPNSPAAKGGLVSFFDFIVAANGISVKTMNPDFVQMIQDFEEKQLNLTVFNWKSHTLREVTLIPSRNWPGDGYLGVTIRYDTYHNAEEDLIHILDVEVNSPADIAGLQAQSDYLLGTVEKVFKNSDVLFNELQQNLNHPVEFYVYNSETDEVRIVVIMPSTDWGGEGILGAGVAHGYLHVLPSACCHTIGKSHESVQKGANSAFGVNDLPPSLPSPVPVSLPAPTPSPTSSSLSSFSPSPLLSPVTPPLPSSIPGQTNSFQTSSLSPSLSSLPPLPPPPPNSHFFQPPQPISAQHNNNM